MGLLDGIKRVWNGAYYERDVAGNHFYKISTGNFSGNQDLLEMSLNHPILTPALNFVTQTFAHGKFAIRNKNTGAIIKKHWLLDLLESPNYYQSGIDFLVALEHLKITLGSAIIYPKAGIGANPTELFVLNPELIEFPNDFTTELAFRDKIKNTDVIYDKEGVNLKLKLGDLIYVYDQPNSIALAEKGKVNHFKAESRLQGLRQTLINTNDSLIAKNIVLKSNGKEMITGSSNMDGFPLSDDEKQEAEKLFSGRYGLSHDRSRTLITKADITWKSLHIALRDLGLDESVKVDGNLIYTALHIPKDIISLEAKKTTYNNFKESMVAYIQNETSTSLSNFCSSLGKELLPDNLELIGDYNHLPVMKFILLQTYDITNKQADALKKYIEIGIEPSVALGLVNMDTTITITKPKVDENNGQQTGEEGDEREDNEDE